MISVLLYAGGAEAANLFWDPGITNNGAAIDPGSGSWNTTTSALNWNNGSGNVNWTQASTTSGTMGAIFNGTNADVGTYQVAVDGGQVSGTNMVINASGYLFSGGPIYLNAIPTPLIVISNGVSVIFSNNATGGISLTGNNANAELRAGDNGPAASVTVLGAITGWQSQFSSTNGSVFYLGNGFGTAGVSSSGAAHVNADVRMTNGTWNANGAFVIGRVRGASSSQPNNSTGVLTLDGPSTIFNNTSDYISVGRDSIWNSTLIIQNGATLNYQTGTHNNNVGLGIPRPASSGANNQSWVKVLGGTVNMGPGSDASGFPRTIFLAAGGSRSGQKNVLTQSGGVINAWGGIQFGNGTGTYDGGTAALTNSGGFLYIGAYNGDGLKAVTPLPPTNYITFSGGTIGALQSWHSSANLPITLDTLNGNVTFQCADSFNSPFNITLDQALNGPGGFNKTGGGKLTLNNALSVVNTYAGSTVVSNGMLFLNLSTPAATNGPVTLDGSAGAPDLVVYASSLPSSAGQHWSIGTMTFASGTPQIEFQYQAGAPSPTVATIQVTGDLNFTATPNVVVANASGLAKGTYQLISYTGSSSGTPPTTVTLPSYCSGYVSNSSTAKQFLLVITASTLTPDYVWGVNSANWDFGSLNWKTNNGPLMAWSDNNAAVFDDTAPGGPNISVTLNTTVSPADVKFKNFTNEFTIAGTGNISSGSMELMGNVNGGGTVTLSTTNTYPGGTTVQNGSLLNINSGGNGSGSPVGTGTLTLNATARLGNSSGSPVALQYPVPQSWNGNFSFVGPSDLDLGSGPVTLGNSVTLNVVANNLRVAGDVTDGANAYQLTKTGIGTLTLAGNNSWNGLEVSAGQVNLNSSGAAGFGSVKITGGTVVVDNTSAADVVLGAGGYDMQSASAFTFLGTTNLDFGSGTIAANGGGITFNVVNNTWTTAGVQAGNSLITKTGNGTWVLGGFDAINTAIVPVNQGEFDMARGGGNTAIGTGGAGSYGGSHGLVVNNSAVAKILTFANQISHGAGGNSYVEVILNTGVLDLNGNSQGVDMISMTNGVLRNSADNTSSVLTITGTGGAHPTNALTLTGANCVFDTPPTNADLQVAAMINGSGSLVKTGYGTATLQRSNSYAGNLTVSAGALTLSYPDISPNATVTVAGGATLNLNFANSDTNTVAALILNGSTAAAGLHNAGTDPAYITGNGNLLVVPAPTINPNPGVLQYAVSGSSLSLAWPTNAGWILLTNAVGLTASNAWFPYPGSTSVTNVVISTSATNVFFRMKKP